MGNLGKWPDERIIKAIQAGGASKEKAVIHAMNDFIHYIPTVSKKTGLTEELALDAFTDAILDMIEQVENGVFKGGSKLSTYFYKIFYFKSVDLFRKKTTNKVDYTEDMPELKDVELSAARKIEIDEEVNQLYKYMDQLGEPCRQILMDWGFWGYSMAEIAERTDLKGSKQAKDRKYKCLMKLRALLK